MNAFWSVAIASTTALAAVVALCISAWNIARIARAERPVEWSVNATRHEGSPAEADVWDVDFTCGGVDALSFMVELHAPHIFTRENRPLLPVGESVRFQIGGPTRFEAWVRVSWCHPKDRNRPLLAWFPLFQDGKAHYESIRENSSHPIIQWIRANVILSPVRPGFITGRRTGWRDRLDAKRFLKSISNKRWVAPLPYGNE